MQAKYSKEFSLSLHVQLMDFCLRAWSDAKVCPLNLCLAGERSYFNEALPQWQGLNSEAQQGDDLGERLFYGIQSGLAQAQLDGVILVGSDCPFIDENYLSQACAKLTQHELVIGPASDGGYVLLGLKGAWPELFQQVDWGQDCVFQQTLAHIKALGLSHFVLPVLDDIDRPDDIALLPFDLHS